MSGSFKWVQKKFSFGKLVILGKYKKFWGGPVHWLFQTGVKHFFRLKSSFLGDEGGYVLEGKNSFFGRAKRVGQINPFPTP